LVDSDDTWLLLAKNFEYVEGAQISNSLVCLLALSESEDPMSTTDISKYIARKTNGQIYKVSATIKESLENRLKKVGYVEGNDIPSKQRSKDSRKKVRASVYRITPKGRKLLKGWLGFLKALSH
jgi:DNA-binding PadR family transcriptional regulator